MERDQVFERRLNETERAMESIVSLIKSMNKYLDALEGALKGILEGMSCIFDKSILDLNGFAGETIAIKNTLTHFEKRMNELEKSHERLVSQFWEIERKARETCETTIDKRILDMDAFLAYSSDIQPMLRELLETQHNTDVKLGLLHENDKKEKMQAQTANLIVKRATKKLADAKLNSKNIAINHFSYVTGTNVEDIQKLIDDGILMISYSKDGKKCSLVFNGQTGGV